MNEGAKQPEGRAAFRLLRRTEKRAAGQAALRKEKERYDADSGKNGTYLKCPPAAAQREIPLQIIR